MNTASLAAVPSAPLRPKGGAVQCAALAVLAALFPAFLLAEYGWQQALLAAAAVLLGVVFQRCQFGFASTWRALLQRGDARGLRAQMLWIFLSVLPFALLTGAGDVFPAQAAANIRPLTLAVAAGAFIFGIGMQLGGACTSGSIVGAGGGSLPPLAGIAGFIGGAVWAASHIDLWNTLPGLAEFSFYHEWGLAGAAAMMAICAAVGLSTFLLPPRPAPALAPVKGRWSLNRGAVLLAALTTLLLALGGQPWGFINGFSIAGGKLVLAAGHEDVLFWDFWARLGGEDVLLAGWFAGAQNVTTVAMLCGVALAAAFAGEIKAPWRDVSLRRLLLALAGGLAMGYGAQISFGCNIGSYVSALSSGSAHGWLWLAAAFAGTAVGVRLRKTAGLD